MVQNILHNSRMILFALLSTSLLLLAGCSGDNAAPPTVDVAAVVQATLTAVAQNATSAPATATTMPADTPTATPLVDTPTPHPTATPQPTTAPQPTTDPNPPLSLPFSDNFNNGLNPQWRVIGVEPITSDGQLTSPIDQETTVEIGNASLDNYTLEFTLSSHEGKGFDNNSKIRFFFSPTFQALMEIDYYGSTRIQWYDFKENEWKLISTSSEFSVNKFGSRIKLEVSGDTYSAYVDGQLVNRIIYGQREGGAPLAININSNSIRIDDLIISENSTAMTDDPNLALSLPFNDDFDNGLNPQWRVVGMKPVTTDGQLAAPLDQKTAIEIGNASLDNYTLEFTLSSHEGKGFDNPSEVRFFFSPTFQALMEIDYYGPTRIQWYDFKENDWKLISTSSKLSVNKFGSRIKLEVSGDTYSAYVDGQLVNRIIYGQREGGAPLAININSNSIRIDDLIISENSTAMTDDPNLALSLPFNDDFDNGLNPQWRVVGMKPVTTDGQLAAPLDQKTAIEIGNASLDNYTLEFTLSSHEGKGFDNPSEVRFFFSPTFQALMEIDYYGPTRIQWYGFKENEWKLISSSSKFQVNRSGSRIQLEVSGNTYRIYDDGQLAGKIIYGQRETGAPFGLSIYSNSIRIDDLSIR